VSRGQRPLPAIAGIDLFLIFADSRPDVLVDEFAHTKVLHLPIQSIVRVEEVDRKGQLAIRDAATGEKVVMPFPMPAKPGR